MNSSVNWNSFWSAITLMGLLGVVCLGIWGCTQPAPASSAPSQARLRALELRCVQLEKDYRIVAEIRDSAHREIAHLKEQLLGYRKIQEDLHLWRAKYQQLTNSMEQAQRELVARAREGEELRQQVLQYTRERDQLADLLLLRTQERDDLHKQVARIQSERESLRKQLQMRMNEREILLARCDKLRKGLKALLENDSTEVVPPVAGGE